MRQLGLIDELEINAIDELTEEQYQNYIKNRNKMIDFQNDQKLFRIMEVNYEEIYKSMDKFSYEYSQDSSMSWIKMDNMTLEINRHILNFLSACRTFLDHTETSINRRFGTKSKQLEKFKLACSNEYDNNFSYRFLYKLRNYAQHCGLPAGNISIGSTETSSEEVEYFISVKFDRDSLLNNYDSWGIPVKGELQELPSLFEVNRYIDEVMVSFERINLVLIEERLPNTLEGADYISALINPIIDKPGIPCILNMKGMKQDGGNIQVEWLPLHLVEMVNKYK